MADAADTPETLPGGRNRPTDGAMESADDLAVTKGTRRRLSDPHLAFVADKEIVKERTQWWEPEMKSHRNTTLASPVEGRARRFLRGPQKSVAEFRATD